MLMARCSDGGLINMLGREYALSELKTMDEEQKEVLLKRFQLAGCRKVRIMGKMRFRFIRVRKGFGC